ncbi:hypothetical protein [Variovorax boronicumulans]|nr:hypothetical protein [Variovorax boronicumulans]
MNDKSLNLKEKIISVAPMMDWMGSFRKMIAYQQLEGASSSGCGANVALA